MSMLSPKILENLKAGIFLNGYSTSQLFYVPNLHENGLNTIETFKEYEIKDGKRVYNEMI